jgi:UPF0042 nucleotide-binding protein
MADTPDDLSTLYSDSHLRTVITSFGENHVDIPQGDALLVDTRTLRNPPDDPAVRARMLNSNGLDPEVRRYVMATEGARQLVDDAVQRVVILLHHWGNPVARRVDVAVMCGGGRHRSVAVAEEIGAGLRAHGIGVEIEHPHIDKPLRAKPRPQGEGT